MLSEETDRKLSEMDRLMKQLLLRLMKVENNVKDLQNKLRLSKNEITAIKELTSNRRFG